MDKSYLAYLSYLAFFYGYYAMVDGNPYDKYRSGFYRTYADAWKP